MLHVYFQILKAMHFISNFLEENPLCFYSMEISVIKKLLRNDDELKLRQKTSSLVLMTTDGLYKCKYNLRIPVEYPNDQVR